jgi:hypothetical protein
MQVRLIIGLIAFSAVTPTAAIAGDSAKRQTCPKIEQPQPRQQAQQHRVRPPECRTQRSIPPVIDPTPLFLL